MNMRNLTSNELRSAALFSSNFDYMQAARREIVRRFLNGRALPADDNAPPISDKSDYDAGFEDGFDEAKGKYAL